MPRPRPPRRVSLSVLLFALVVMPTVGVGTMAIRETNERADVAAWARDLEALTEQFVILGDLRTAVGDEQVFGSAAALLENGGLEVDPVDIEAVIGTDLSSLRRSFARATDAAFRRADAEVLAPALAGNGPIAASGAQDLRGHYEAVVAMRTAIDERRADFGEVVDGYSAVGGDLSKALAAMASELLRTSAMPSTPTEGVSTLTGAIRDLLTVTTAMSRELTGASAIVFSGELEPGQSLSEDDIRAMRVEIRRAIIGRELADAAAGASMPAAFAERWQQFRSDERVRTFEGAIESIAEDRPIDLSIAQLAQHGLARVQLVSKLLSDLLHEVGTAAARTQALAERQLRTTIVVLVGLVGLTLLSLVLVVVAISRPLRRLAARAQRVRSGTLAAPVRTGSAIAEIDGVETVFEDIVANLRAVEEQATALVEGRAAPLDVLEGDDPDPGPLGASVRSSLRRLAEVTAQLQASEALSNAIVETAAEAIWTLDASGVVQRTNAAAHELVGVHEDAGWRLIDRVAPEERRDVERFMHGAGLDSHEAHLVRVDDGTFVPVLLSSSTVELGAERFITVIARDITERKDFEAQLEHHAATDPLSGLANRRTAMATIADALKEAARTGDGIAVVFCDLDGFKEANDLYGHAFGDAVLREVATRFQGATRAGDTLARLGGDEFVVVVEHVADAPAAAPVAERLLASLRDPVVVGERRVRVSGSFGVAWADASQAASDVLRDADTAMFTAKSAGGSRVQIFDQALQQGLHERIDIEAGLRQALDADELSFVYQPVVAITGEVLGVEALVRWHRPGHGTIPPGAFIAVAEQSDLIVQIGRWGLNTAAAQLAAWDRLVPPTFHVAVNIAGVHLSRYDIVGDVRRAIEQAGISPAQLRIEITETQLVDDLRVAADAMRRLVELGVSVVVDDYGTGFSSISYLRELPLHGIKIDRSFINRLGTPRERAMVESVVALARLLELEVTAEGVETEEQQLLSQRIGCDSVQGYHIARPMPVDEVTAWVADRVTTFG